MYLDDDLYDLQVRHPNELSEEYIQIIDSWELNPIRVTNLEKTIVDSFREQKLMTFIIQEMIDDYIQRDPKDVRKLIEYAERFGVADVVGREILPFVLK